jgi:Flp pilus assembly protein TadG
MVVRILGACRRLLSDRRGMSAMELTLVALVLVPAIFALVELGNAAQQQIQLQQALRAGGQYAMKYGCTAPCTGTSAANISHAVTAALPSNWNVTVGAPTSSCVCSNSGVSCNTTACASPNMPQTSITLTASMPYTGTIINTTINAGYVVRSQ